jgi:hypothetical protein
VQATASTPAQAASNGVQCLEAGLFTDSQAVVLRQAAQTALPEGSWQMDALTQPARWIVYMGKYADPQALARKRTELVALRVRFEPLANPELEPGLSLGGFTQGHQHSPCRAGTPGDAGLPVPHQGGRRGCAQAAG